jgi:anti-anti-sigma factor
VERNGRRDYISPAQEGRKGANLLVKSTAWSAGGPSVSITAKLEKHGKTPLVRVMGKVADDDVQRVAERMDQAFARNTPQVILDLTGVEFMDSRGLGTVVYYHTMLQRQKRELIVLNGTPSGFLHELFETTHLNNVLRVISDLKQLG